MPSTTITVCEDCGRRCVDWQHVQASSSKLPVSLTSKWK